MEEFATVFLMVLYTLFHITLLLQYLAIAILQNSLIYSTKTSIIFFYSSSEEKITLVIWRFYEVAVNNAVLCSFIIFN
jgi:hypothetical protein